MRGVDELTAFRCGRDFISNQTALSKRASLYCCACCLSAYDRQTDRQTDRPTNQLTVSRPSDVLPRKAVYPPPTIIICDQVCHDFIEIACRGAVARLTDADRPLYSMVRSVQCVCVVCMCNFLDVFIIPTDTVEDCCVCF